MAPTQYPSRPTQTEDLVGRLKSRDTDPKEVEALQALSNKMIRVFQKEPLPYDVREAAALASIVTAKDYGDLFQAFVDGVTHKDHPEYLIGLETITKVFKDKPPLSYGLEAVAPSPLIKTEDQDCFRTFVNVIIVGGIQDGNNVDRKLSEGFKAIIEKVRADLPSSLSKGAFDKINNAISGTANCTDLDPKLLIGLIFALNRAEGVKWAGMRFGPLVDHLRRRLEDAVNQVEEETQYQLVPLLRIPNDEGPYKALWRHVRTIGEGTAKLASAVSTMDPSRLFDGLTTLQDFPDLLASMRDVFEALSNLYNGVEDATPRQKSWYAALRCADFLIDTKAFHHLEALVLKIPRNQEKEFLCGLYAHLEQAWVVGDAFARGEIVRFLDQVLVKIGSISKHPCVREWVKLIADTLEQPNWKNTVQPVPQSSLQRLLLRKKKEYAPTISKPERRDETLSRDLLEKAWSDCNEANVFYADIKIREHYLQNEEAPLKVERLSGDSLSMDRCYINLALVEQQGRNVSRSEEGDTKPQSSQFSLHARLKIETPPLDNQVSLDSLFSSRKAQDGKEALPERILIRGQAGVGKTTLCKKIVHEYLHGKIWPGLFTRLLWVPLRTLKGSSTDLKGWLRNNYFRAGDGDILARALIQAIGEPNTYGKTLFILDGQDEVRHESERETPGILKELLAQSHVIITSRPAGISLAHTGRIDLELETVGFYPDQVVAYIKKAAPDQAEEIQSFIQEHWLIQGLVRIPIQLEALCYSWDARTVNSGLVPKSMTTLYQAIERKLWKKDSARLGKSTVNEAKRALDNEIKLQVLREISFLRGLAFTGLFNDAIEFDAPILDIIWKHWNVVMGFPPSGEIRSENLADLSFLRSSDTSLSESRSYHFLHLTFQEFFAAQYFVEYWKSDKLLPCLVLNSGNFEPIKAENFLRKEKYNARYDILWRFVVGLLQVDCDETHNEQQLCRFFKKIEGQPRDLLGPAHQRLVMHCLSEVVLPQKIPEFNQLRADLEGHLLLWAEFECNLQGYSCLAAEMEFPEYILELVLRESPEDMKTKILKSLSERPKISTSIMDLVASWLGDNVLRSLKIEALNMFQYQSQRSTCQKESLEK
ncbi:hypothetical protein G7Y89_g1439 [Cudoniella acicularis]|uniref:NACHT domain-containing protein n=1 Tax=Cudoniella acicularis TaxID=354080 RepID=A0A8H4W7W4_9HELO|nr:hypothetical protein G7Y89_g1439 [Cudoniella acicularis]